MTVIVHEFSVPFVYPVHFTTGAFDPSNLLVSELLSPVVAAGNRIVFLIDAQLSQASPALAERITGYCQMHGLETLSNPLSLFYVPGGESAKGNYLVIQELLRYFAEVRLGRHSVVVVLGGGAVLDLVGCVASAMWCGVRILHVPTTVVAQSCVGHSLKHTLHSEGRANILGVFSAPLAVVNDVNLLDSLPQQEYLSGMSEIVKLAVSQDAELFQYLEQRVFDIEGRQKSVVQHLIERAVGLHAHHLVRRGDPFEHGSRRPLEFGYWLARRLRALSHFEVSHGEALLVGMQIDAMYAHISEALSESDLQRFVWLCGRLGGGRSRSAATMLLAPGEIDAALIEFEQRTGAPPQLPFLKKIGEVGDVGSVDQDRLRESIEIISQLEAE